MIALLAIVTPKKANAQYGHITSHSFRDTCASIQFFVSDDSVTSLARLETSYGDGTKDTATGINYFAVSHSYITAGTYTVKQVLITSTMRVDSIVFPLNFSGCGLITASYYIDLNADCIYDSTDKKGVGHVYFEVDSSGYAIDTIDTWESLHYHARGSGVPYSFKALPSNRFALTCPATGIINVRSVSGASVDAGDIGFSCISGSGAFDVGISPNIYAYDKGCIAWAVLYNTNCDAQSGSVSLTIDPKYNIDYIFPSSGVISGNVVSWSYSNLTIFNSMIIGVAASVPGLALKKGDSVVTKISCPWLAGDIDTSNNTYTIADTVRGPWDPNSKAVMPEGNIAAGTRLTYTLSFENTGNAPAENIHILDTLSRNLDVKSMQILTSTHPVNLDIINIGSINVLKFDFPAINLLDSSHHGQCNGFVTFSISSKAGLAPATKIDNRAGIYFDDNAVVMTNTVENIVNPMGVSVVSNSSNVTTYPNPVADILTIKTDKAYDKLTIINCVGQTLLQQTLQNKETHVNVKALIPGMYYIMLKNADGVKVEKIEKL